MPTNHIKKVSRKNNEIWTFGSQLKAKIGTRKGFRTLRLGSPRVHFSSDNEQIYIGLLRRPRTFR